MDMMGVVARANGISNDLVLNAVNNLAEGCLFWKERSDWMPLEEASYFRVFILTWFYIYVGTIVLYLVVAGLDYLFFFVLFQKRFIPGYVPNYPEMRREISFSFRSLVVMSAMVAPAEVLISEGYSKMYGDVYQYGLLYFCVSPLLFLLFSDFFIYWAHRMLHHRSIYKYIHKPHHSFVHTTPFAAFAFHPIDGYIQGVAYQIFIFCFPFHSFLHLVSLAAVGIWTINIHDRVDLKLPFINGAGHHLVHHTTFRSNYGQYFTFSDRLFGTFRDPEQWKSVVKKEEDVYSSLQ